MLVAQVCGAPRRRATSTLPATIRGFDETDIYAKVPGYLKTIKVDKGDRIHTGQLLAILESPETDQQVANARANYKLAHITDKRNQILRAQQASSRSRPPTNRTPRCCRRKATLEQYDRPAGLRDDHRALRRHRHRALRRSRPSGSREQPARPRQAGAIITVARMTPLRVFTYVPQNVAPFIKDGDAATITVNEYPGRKFTGTITRHPEALSPDTRTMLVEVDLPNDETSFRECMGGRSSSFDASRRADGPR